MRRIPPASPAFTQRSRSQPTVEESHQVGGGKDNNFQEPSPAGTCSVFFPDAKIVASAGTVGHSRRLIPQRCSGGSGVGILTISRNALVSGA